MINLGTIVVKKIDVMNIWRKRVTESVNELINYEAFYRTAPATQGLLKITKKVWKSTAQKKKCFFLANFALLSRIFLVLVFLTPVNGICAPTS